MDRDQGEYDPLVLRVRGLPWSASKDDISKFFGGCNIKNGGNGIHMTMSREGRPSGEAYVEFETEADADKGLEKDNEHLGSRYIEVFRSKANEMEWALRRCGLDGEDALGEACVRLRGLPFGCSKEEIAQFFTGLEIVRNGITLPTDGQGRSGGEAYVQFASQDIAEKAMAKNKEKIGHRYIEIFKSSLQEINMSMNAGPVRMGRSMGSNRMNPYDRMERPSGFGRGARRGIPSGGHFGTRGEDFSGGGGRIRDTGHSVHMRGLPFKAVERDIFQFFMPTKPIAVRIKLEPSGRASGEADAMFGTHEEAVQAMQKDKEKIQHRYIELFLHSEPEPYGGGSSSFGGGPREQQFGGQREQQFGGPGRFGGGGGSRGFGGGFGGGPNRGGFRPGPARGGGFGSPGGLNRGFGAPASQDQGFGGGSRDMGFSEDKPFNQGNGGADNSFNNPGSDGQGFPAMGDRSFGQFQSPNDGFRNGVNRSNESEFFGSGKLFAETSYPVPTGQGMNNMMGGSSNYGF